MFARLTTVLLPALLAACGAEAAPRGPNIVLIVIDTLRADRLPFHGGPAHTAPFLAELAATGLVFENARSASSWTAPATASILTGLYPDQHGVTMGLKVHMRLSDEAQAVELNRIPDGIETVASFLRGRGYRTFAVTDNPNVSERLGFDRDFERFACLPPARKGRWGGDSAAVHAQLLEWRDAILSSGRFFLYVHYMDPHGPYTRHEQWLAPDAPPPPADNFDDLAAYDSEIRAVDEQIRELFAAFELGEDTVVIVTADHGQEFRDHGGVDHPFQLYDELLHVPLLVWRGGAPGTAGRVSEQVSNIDVLPTLRALLGAPPAQNDAGRPLIGPLAPARALLAMRTDVNPEGTARKHAVVHGGYKLILSEPEGTHELYDLAADPDELHDVAQRHPETVAALRTLLELHQRRAAAFTSTAAEPWQPNADELELLRQIGYVSR